MRGNISGVRETFAGFLMHSLSVSLADDLVRRFGAILVSYEHNGNPRPGLACFRTVRTSRFQNFSRLAWEKNVQGSSPCSEVKVSIVRCRCLSESAGRWGSKDYRVPLCMSPSRSFHSTVRARLVQQAFDHQGILGINQETWSSAVKGPGS
jgi:hypothetical protein